MKCYVVILVFLKRRKMNLRFKLACKLLGWSIWEVSPVGMKWGWRGDDKGLRPCQMLQNSDLTQPNLCPRTAIWLLSHSPSLTTGHGVFYWSEGRAVITIGRAVFTTGGVVCYWPPRVLSAMGHRGVLSDRRVFIFYWPCVDRGVCCLLLAIGACGLYHRACCLHHLAHRLLLVIACSVLPRPFMSC